MSLSSDGTVMTMPVQPAYQGSGSGSMWGNDWMSFIVLFLIFGLFGGWGGYGGFGGGQTGGVGSEVQRGFDHSAVVTKLDGITQGICDSTYAITNAMTNGFNNTNMGMMQGFNGVERGFCNLSAQLAQCCCENREAIGQVRYDMAAQACDTRNTIQNTTRDIIDNQNNGVNAIMGKLAQMEYNGLNDKYQAALAENQALKFQASQTAQNAFITANQEAQTAELLRRLGRDCPVPAYWVNPPTPVPVPCGTCNTCGC